ncbi:plasmid replication protein RepB [Aeromonas salmonicida]|uniref:plasmid replication protein RepB n=1 Tax=Aeromonas salmonicida TaxID=645 RepID=UPI000F7B4A31|nr:plasmid replication protein RepB [Aeromonas salmonicida]RSM21142.1 plasmid replication protein RepB [Aeromonas salmonicida]
MEEKQAKWVFDQGGFSKALVVPAPMEVGYCLHLVKFGKADSSEVLKLQRGGERVFKTIDGAVSVAKQIGFRRIEVDLRSL